MTKELLEASQLYFVTRIEIEYDKQVEPDERLFTALGQVAFKLSQLEVQDD